MVTRKEVAKFFGVSPKTIWVWSNTGKLPFTLTPGGRRRYDLEQIKRTFKPKSV